MERKKPRFRRQDSHKKPKIKERWRRARGLQSKVRLAKRGYLKKPKTGYGTPKKEKEVIRVRNLSDLEKAEGKDIIIKKIGMKKKMAIVKKAIERNINMINVKEPKKFLKEAEDKLNKRKKERKKRGKKKEDIKKQAKKEADKKKESEEKESESEEEKKEREKKEKDKVLTKKDQ